ncbi:MAG: 4-(cytidine 5'-diphospho)-2-C-methyl-D-erythritol kinase [Evtepia sp.]
MNLYDDSLEFEAIHRVLFGVDPKKLMADFLAAYPGAHYGEGEGHQITYVLPGGEKGVVTVPNPTAQLEVGTLQTFLDKYLEENGGKIDYIHGEDVVESLVSQPDSIGFLLPSMTKDQLFPTVIFDGALPGRPSPWARPTTSASIWKPGKSSDFLTLPAPAKINLTLDILGARPDGYHEMEMVMQSVSLCDTIRLDLGFAGGVRASSGLQFLPNDKDNLAVAAALAFRKATGQTWRDLLITIEKRIPVCAGTAGGSSDAAAVLRGLNELTDAGLSPQALAKIGEEVGSDVPYCVLGTTALAGGRGEALAPLSPLPPCWIVLCKPRFSISTPALFRAWDKGKRRLRPDTKGILLALEAGDLVEVARRMFNVFEGVLPPPSSGRSKASRLRSSPPVPWAPP